MKTRLKNKKEKEYDQKLVEDAMRKLAEQAVIFANEFAECDGDVFYSTYQDFANKSWQYEREKENAKMTKVGLHWDFETNVCGAYRYNGI